MTCASKPASRTSISSLLCLVVFAGINGCDSIENRLDSRKSTNPDTWTIQDERQAIAKVIEIVGLPEDAASEITATLITLADNNTPFLSDQIVHRPLWRVTIDKWRLELDSAAPGFEDRLERTFDVLVAPETGKVLMITSRWPEGMSEIPEEPPARFAEEQMQRSGAEIYHGFPSAEPFISFVQALDVVLKEGFGSPLQAKQIIANYVVQSRMGGEPRAVWAIILRGIHMVWPGGPSGMAPRIMFRMRNIVDATTGKLVLATYVPQPHGGSYLTQEPEVLPDDPPSVILDSSSPNEGNTVSPGQLVEWKITATVSTGDNDGLAMVAVDLVQHASNPELVEIPPGNRPPDMEDFDRPNGISNPAVDGYYDSAYGGTQFGADLLQIGGAQNIFGAMGDGIGLDTQVDASVGQGPGGQVIATGALMAPCTPGVYIFSIDSGVANVLEQVNQAPQFSLVRSAEILYSEVQGGCGNCDVNQGGLGCSDPVCEAIVCGIDPFCCNVGWDRLCADQAIQSCDCNSAASPFDFNVAGSPVCPVDIVGPDGGAPDGQIAINDFLALLGTWGRVGLPADYIDPPGVGKEDFLLLLYYWGVCPCTQGTAPAPLQEEFVDAGLVWPDDWDTFMDCMQNGATQANCACWMKYHLDGGGVDPDPDPTNPFGSLSAAVSGGCPGSDPLGP